MNVDFWQEDTVVMHTRKQKLEKYDRYFKKFEYSKALDAALSVSKNFVMKTKLHDLTAVEQLFSFTLLHNQESLFD
jgi:hypothetical protein